VSNMTPFIAVIENAKRDLLHDDGRSPDPDGVPVRYALLVAERTAAVAVSVPAMESPPWFLFAATMGDALAELQDELPEPYALPRSLQPRAGDVTELQRAVIGLVEQLATLYRTAAEGPIGPPRRRLVWAQVASHLDTAVGHLR
jgi:hypothetical protein